jgi:hypothetical protein
MDAHKIVALLAGIFSVFFMVYLLIGFLPPMKRRQEQWEHRIKGGEHRTTPISPLRRIVLVLLGLLALSVVWANVFGRDLGTMLGISDTGICTLMIALAVLSLLLGTRDRRVSRKKDQDARQ